MTVLGFVASALLLLRPAIAATVLRRGLGSIPTVLASEYAAARLTGTEQARTVQLHGRPAKAHRHPDGRKIQTRLDIIVRNDDVRAMRYDGGKGKCFQRIINLMPPHRVYVEAFLGGGAVLRHKKPAERTIAIDIDPSVIAKWRRILSSDVELRCEDALHFLRENRFVGDELVYADPPYLPCTRRRSRCYRYDFETSDHLALLSLLGQLDCAVIISGYPSRLYDEVLSGWQRVDFSGTSHVGRRVEAVWVNFEAAVGLHDYRFLGDTFRDRERLRRKLARWEDRLARMPVLERQALLNALNERFLQVTSAGRSPISRPSLEREAPTSIVNMPGMDG